MSFVKGSTKESYETFFHVLGNTKQVLVKLNSKKVTHGVRIIRKNVAIRDFFVFPTHDEGMDHNRSRLSDLNKTFPVAKIVSVSKGPHSKTFQSENNGGHLDKVYVC